MALDRQPTQINTDSIEYFHCARPANYAWNCEKDEVEPVCANYKATIVDKNVFVQIRKAYPASRVVK